MYRVLALVAILAATLLLPSHAYAVTQPPECTMAIDNVIVAKAGTIEGTAGNDLIFVRSGVVYGKGGDDCIVSSGSGIVYAGGGDDVVILSLGGIAYGQAGNDTLIQRNVKSGIANGGSGSDTCTGWAIANSC